MTWIFDVHWNGKLYLNVLCSSLKKNEKNENIEVKEKVVDLLSFNHNFENGFRLTQ
jgi:hypothetical protein